MFIGQPGKNQAALTIKGYQNPGQYKNLYEANWLLVELSIQTPEHQWKSTAPAMLTNEMDCFIDWLQALVEDRASSRFFDFLEPLFYVSLQDKNNGRYQFIFHLQLDFKPPFAKDAHEFQLPLELSSQQLHDWIAELKTMAAKYPVIYIIREP